MKVLVSGAAGLVGAALVPVLEAHGHRVVRFVRRAPQAGGGEVQWSPEKPLDPAAVEGYEAVVHLAGENILGRWTVEKKQAIRDSRVLGTQTIAEAIAKAANPPKTLLCASAIGYYGSRGDESLTEGSARGKGFLAEVACEWEAAAQAVVSRGVRVVNLRIGIVLSERGGALKAMLPAFRLGAGGKVGSGKQWMSWISLADLVDVILFCLNNAAISGPVNAVAPTPETNAEFSATLARVLHRPAFFTVPAFAPKLIYGPEMVENTLLASTRAVPEKLLASGYNFRHSTVDAALRYELQS